MSGTSKSQQISTTQQNSNPWAPAQPALNDILSGIQGQIPNATPNATETGALQQLTNNAQTQQNFGGTATNLANSYLGGDPTGLLQPALSAYQGQLNPIANQNNDPMKTPGIQNLLNTIRSDVSNQVNGQFAGAGRDLSGMNQQTLARGISQGEAAPLLNQYNQNVAAQTGAAGNLFNAAGQTAGAITGNQGQGLNIANLVPGFTNANANQTLAAQAAARGLPLNNLGMLANLTVPIAGLGGQNFGYSNTQSQQTPSGLQQAMGWSQALGGSQGGGLLGAAGKGLGALTSIFGA